MQEHEVGTDDESPVTQNALEPAVERTLVRERRQSFGADDGVGDGRGGDTGDGTAFFHRRTPREVGESSSERIDLFVLLQHERFALGESARERSQGRVRGRRRGAIAGAFGRQGGEFTARLFESALGFFRALFRG